MTKPEEISVSTAVMSLTDVANMDFREVFKKAVDIFSDQAMLSKDVSEITIKDLEISKAKANNFLDAIAGILELSRQVDILSAEKYKFKRVDELEILNSLRRTIALQAKSLEKNAFVAQSQLDIMINDPLSTDPEKLALVQSVLNSSIDVGNKLITSTAKLIHLERHSGGGSWGNHRHGGLSIKTIDGLDLAGRLKGKATASSSGPRELTPEDIQNLDDED